MVEYTSAYRRDQKSTQQPAEPIQGGTSMIKHKSLSRRRLLKGAGAAGAMTITGFPAISYAQADVIKIGHLTPRTGFLMGTRVKPGA
jgi:secreted PhoX family phosphatase